MSLKYNPSGPAAPTPNVAIVIKDGERIPVLQTPKAALKQGRFGLDIVFRQFYYGVHDTAPSPAMPRGPKH